MRASERYTIAELRTMYRRIAGTKNAVDVLSGLAVCTKDEARLLVDVFNGTAESMPDDPPMPQPPYGASEWMW